jgi:hypothetical protein
MPESGHLQVFDMPEPVTLRDRFAMAALKMSGAFTMDAVRSGTSISHLSEDDIAKKAYKFADAMIRARKEDAQ